MKISAKNFGPFESVHLDLDCKDGTPLRLVAIYGANGSGKTHLCKILGFLTEITTTYRIQGLTCPHHSYKEVTKGVIRKGSNKDLSLSYNFNVNGKKNTYSIKFDKDGELLFEELHGDYGSSDGFNYFRYDKAASKNNPNKIGLQPRYCNHQNVNQILRENIDKHTMLSTLLLYPGLKDYIREDLREVLDIIERMVVPERYLGGPVGDWCRGTIYTGNIEELRARENVLSSILKGTDNTICEVRYKTSERMIDCPGSNTLDYYLVISRIVEGILIENTIDDECDGIKHLVRILPNIIPATSWKMAVIDDFDLHLGECLTMALIDQLSTQINGQLIVTLKTAEPIRNLDPRCVFIIDIDENGHRSLMTVKDKVNSGRSNNNAIRFRNGILGGVPTLGSMEFDVASNNYRRMVKKN